MYEKCQAGCLSLFPEERVSFPRPDGELFELEGAQTEQTPQVEPKRGTGVMTPEGAAADENERLIWLVDEPPVGWLSTLWSGGEDGETYEG